MGWETVFRTLLLELSYEMSYADAWLGDVVVCEKMCVMEVL